MTFYPQMTQMNTDKNWFWLMRDCRVVAKEQPSGAARFGHDTG